jgi:hypothetical protein
MRETHFQFRMTPFFSVVCLIPHFTLPTLWPYDWLAHKDEAINQCPSFHVLISYFVLIESAALIRYVIEFIV